MVSWVSCIMGSIMYSWISYVSYVSWVSLYHDEYHGYHMCSCCIMGMSMIMCEYHEYEYHE